ncbi:MAG: glycosyltransferase, partial [Chitinispirillaceae bacterium]|nr:glycosyltransferase [Chitinispirillaceae bacterium]
MIDGKKVVVVLPAYNAAQTLEATYREIPSIVDEIILVDDASKDETVALAKQSGSKHSIKHEKKRGYGR